MVTDACTSVTCRVSTDQSVKVAEDGGRKVLVEVGRHCGYRGGGGSTPRQRRGVDSGRPHAWTGGRGIFGGALLGRLADPSQSRITRGPARSRELPTSISKANDIPGAKRGANGGRRQATPRDVCPVFDHRPQLIAVDRFSDGGRAMTDHCPGMSPWRGDDLQTLQQPSGARPPHASPQRSPSHVPGRNSPSSHPRRDGRVVISDGGDPAACCLACGHPAAQSRSIAGDQAAPDSVLADVPVVQG